MFRRKPTAEELRRQSADAKVMAAMPESTGKPPRVIHLSGKRRELTMEQEEFLGVYDLVRRKREPIKWQHRSKRNYCA